MSGHTPGEWKVFETIHGLGHIVASLGRTTKDESYFVNASDRVADEHLPANARLIAAAPRMYDRIALLAAAGDEEALGIMEAVNGGR